MSVMVADNTTAGQRLSGDQADVRHLPSWRQMNRDTSPEAEAMLFKLRREAPAWRKLEMVGELNRATRQLALMGLHRRFPNASTGELRRSLAAITLGEDLAAGVYDRASDPGRYDLVDSEALQVTLLVTGLLDELGIPYVIGGSVAGAVHGVPRATMDVDIVADIQPKHIPHFLSGLRDAFYADEQMIRQAIQRRGSFNLIHWSTIFKVDVFIPKERPFDRQQLGRRIAQTINPDDDEQIWILSAEDLVLVKLEWFRLGGEVSERQWRDVLGIMKAQLPSLDVAYLRQWAQVLGVSDLMERALQELNDVC